MTDEQDRKSVVLAMLRGLSADQRDTAYRKTEKLVKGAMGAKPQRKDYKNTGFDEYPREFYLILALLLAFVLIMLFVTSIFRVYTAGSSDFLSSMTTFFRPADAAETFVVGSDIVDQSRVVGVATFLGAEVMVVISVVAMNIFFKSRERWLMIVPILLGTGIALVGNWIVVQPGDVLGDLKELWPWLDTITPPVGVMSIALILERLILKFAQARFLDEQNFQAALTTWEQRTAEPRKHARWLQTLADVLKDALREINGRGSGAGSTARDEFMYAMTDQDWAIAVQREIDAEDWYAAFVGAPANPTPPPSQDSPEPTAADGRERSPQPSRPLLATPANTSDRPTG